MKKYGFIGFGNMGKAMAKAIISFGGVAAENVYAYAPNQKKLKKNTAELEMNYCESLTELAEKCDTLIIACKPYQVDEVASTLDDIAEGKNVLSIASGWDYEQYRKLFHSKPRVQCIMPSIPIEIGQGTYILEDKNSLEEADRRFLFELLTKSGTVLELPARHIDAATAISGCGPAFLDLVIEGMADGAVKNGIPRDKAYELVCRTMVGTASLMLESGLHPGQLKDQVCSPGGTTIKGIAALEEAAVRSAFIKAVDATLK